MASPSYSYVCVRDKNLNLEVIGAALNTGIGIRPIPAFLVHRMNDFDQNLHITT